MKMGQEEFVERILDFACQIYIQSFPELPTEDQPSQFSEPFIVEGFLAFRIFQQGAEQTVNLTDPLSIAPRFNIKFGEDEGISQVLNSHRVEEFSSIAKSKLKPIRLAVGDKIIDDPDFAEVFDFARTHLLMSDSKSILIDDFAIIKIIKVPWPRPRVLILCEPESSFLNNLNRRLAAHYHLNQEGSVVSAKEPKAKRTAKQKAKSIKVAKPAKKAKSIKAAKPVKKAKSLKRLKQTKVKKKK